MSESRARQERRSLWATLSFMLAVGIAVSFFLAHDERTNSTRAAAQQARLTAQLQLAPLLSTKDLLGPVTGARYRHLSDRIKDAVTSGSSIDHVTLWSSKARILFDTDRKVVGTRPSYMIDLVSKAAGGSPETRVADGILQTFVPMSSAPDGPVVVAEMDQPLQPIAARATGTWYRLALVLGAGLVITLSLFALSFLRTKRGAPKPAPAVAPAGQLQAARPKRRSNDVPPAGGSTPAYMQPGFRQVEEERRAAVERAQAAEDQLRAVQAQFKQALERARALETQLQELESGSARTDEEAKDLRNQIRDTADRLQAAEARTKELEAELEKAAPGMHASR